MNLLQDLTPDQIEKRSLYWDHPPIKWEPLPEGGIRVTVPAKADYFREPGGSFTSDNAPFLWTKVTGDFVAQARIRPAFNSTYDSGVLMVRGDAEHWAKLCFEATDFGTTAAVSVVTNGVSDDANGANVTEPALWLQMIHRGDIFALHYSVDGQAWRMVRIFRLPLPQSVKVGVVAQCPVGPGTTIDLLHFSVDQREIANLRAGI